MVVRSKSAPRDSSLPGQSHTLISQETALSDGRVTTVVISVSLSAAARGLMPQGDGQHDRILANGKTPKDVSFCFFDCEAGRGGRYREARGGGQSDAEGHALATIRGFRICPTLGQGTWSASMNTTTGPTAPFPA